MPLIKKTTMEKMRTNLAQFDFDSFSVVLKAHLINNIIFRIGINISKYMTNHSPTVTDELLLKISFAMIPSPSVLHYKTIINIPCLKARIFEKDACMI